MALCVYFSDNVNFDKPNTKLKRIILDSRRELLTGYLPIPPPLPVHYIQGQLINVCVLWGGGLSVFLFTRENEKCRRKQFFVFFLGFSWQEIFFLAHFTFFSGSVKFSRAHFRIFLEVTFFFQSRNLTIFSGRFFFSLAEFFQRALNF